ncbi:hypothetical protein FQN60_003441 [Etheostoma spectabile]|uniref:NR LBD domain-containing protein n=1 Tax=Etheostoma spectabile TaxID=54343 RepID=A0A5J5CAS8_9PERO|nr:hypothetical protein FQN60_003441 [Etheostoma spectabile]
MRGGRNKFGPMYKRDRALKQQRKALVQAMRLRTSHSQPLVYSDLTFHTSPLPPAKNDPMSYQAPSLCSLSLSSNSPNAPQYQCAVFSNSTRKSRHSSNWSPGSATTVSLHPGPFSPHGPRMPELVMELVRCDPDEVQLQSKISAGLLREQPDHPSTFRLLCLLADHTLLSIVEWARTSAFFKQLKVNDQMKLLHSCWSDLLLLDFISRQVLFGREGRLLLVTGQEMELSDVASHAGISVASLVQRGQELVEKLHFLKVDRQD